MAQDTEERNETMGRRLASLRALKGWTQAEVADKAGTSQAYISLLENDLAPRPSVPIIEKLARIYDASLEYIVRGGATSAA